MAFDKNAPDYNNWNKASQARKLAQSQWLKYRNTDSAKAEKYKKLYSTAKDQQNMYAAKVRAYKPPAKTNNVTSNSNNNLDHKAHSEAITNGQKASGTNTKINKVETVPRNEGTLSTPNGNGSTNSGLSTSNTASGQHVPGDTTYNSIYGGDKVTTSNDVNKTDYKKVDNKTNAFDSTNASSAYKDISGKITGALNYKGDFNKLKDKTIEKYGSVDAYYKKYKDNLSKQVSSGKLTQSEADDLNKKFDGFMSDKMGYNTDGGINQDNLNTSDAGYGRVNGGYHNESYTDSEGNTHNRRVKNPDVTINYNEITDRLSKSLFGNDTFKSNVNVYVDSLKKQIEDQRKVLESQQSDLQDMFKNQEADFQGQFGDIYSGIEQREKDIKAKFGDIEAGVQQKFNDVQKTMGEQKAGEKAGLEANLRAKGLSEGAISNALTKIDKKYDQSSRKDYAAYTDNMKSLASDYDKLAASISSAKTGLTQNKLAFSNALISRSKALTDAAAKFDTEAVKTLSQPVVDMYKARSDQSQALELNTRTKAEKQARYKQATPEERLTILNDYKISLKGLGVKVDQLSVEDFNKASEFDSQAKALIYLTEKANGTDSTSGSTGNEKLDNFIKTAKENLPENSKSDSTSDSTSDNNTDESINNTSDNSSNNNISNDYKYGVDTNGDGVNDASRDDSGIYKLNKDNGGFNLGDMRSSNADELKNKIETAVNGYYNSTHRNQHSKWYIPFDSKSKDDMISETMQNTYVKDAADYAKGLEGSYPGVEDYTKNKIEEAINVVEKSKEELAKEIASNVQGFDKDQALEFINNRIGNSPKDIMNNYNDGGKKYIELINNRLNEGRTPKDVIEY